MDGTTILGIGNGAGNTLNFISDKLDKDNFDFLYINSEKEVLEKSKIPVLQIGKKLCSGLGCGGSVHKGKLSAEESEEDIKNFLKDVKQLVIISGFGAGCGTGASPVIAEYAVEMGIKTSCILTVPFTWEGKKRREQALDGIELIKEIINGNFVLVYCNEVLKDKSKKISICESFNKVDEKVYEVLNNYILNIE